MLIQAWLNNRGISNEAIKKYGIVWDAQKISIPIRNESGQTLFYKHRRLPDKDTGPKYWYDTGQKVTLFNSAVKNQRPLIISEGEFDCIVLNENGFPAVSSTGGCGKFVKEWLAGNDCYICFDSDDPGRNAAVKLALETGWKIIILPKTIKDVTEYFLKFSSADFKELMGQAVQIPALLNSSPPLENTALEIKALKQQAEILLIEQRKMKKYIEADPQNAWLYNMALEALTKDSEEIFRKITNLQRIPKSSQDQNLNIEKAKQFPIPQLLQINRAKKAKCPWHSPDKNPSLQYYPKNNTVYCFVCNRSGDSIDVAQQIYNISFKDAVLRLTNS